MGHHKPGKKEKQLKLPLRIPTAKPTEWHRDKSKYSRKKKHKKDLRKEVSD